MFTHLILDDWPFLFIIFIKEGSLFSIKNHECQYKNKQLRIRVKLIGMHWAKDTLAILEKRSDMNNVLSQFYGNEQLNITIQAAALTVANKDLGCFSISRWVYTLPSHSCLNASLYSNVQISRLHSAGSPNSAGAPWDQGCGVFSNWRSICWMTEMTRTLVVY